MGAGIADNAEHIGNLDDLASHPAFNTATGLLMLIKQLPVRHADALYVACRQQFADIAAALGQAIAQVGEQALHTLSGALAVAANHATGTALDPASHVIAAVGMALNAALLMLHHATAQIEGQLVNGRALVADRMDHQAGSQT